MLGEVNEGEGRRCRDERRGDEEDRAIGRHVVRRRIPVAAQFEGHQDDDDDDHADLAAGATRPTMQRQEDGDHGDELIDVDMRRRNFRGSLTR